jgi:hypothetical protein
MFTADSLDEGGARLCPRGIAVSTPQTFLTASRAACGDHPQEFPATPTNSSRHHGYAPLPAQIRQVRAGRPKRDLTTPVPLVLLSITLAGPAPSGSTDTSRLCQGCSHPPRHHPDQAAPSSTTLLRQGQRRRSPTSTRINNASWRTHTGTQLASTVSDFDNQVPHDGVWCFADDDRGADWPVDRHDDRPPG